jgi:hypothetical protein
MQSLAQSLLGFRLLSSQADQSRLSAKVGEPAAFSTNSSRLSAKVGEAPGFTAGDSRLSAKVGGEPIS